MVPVAVPVKAGHTESGASGDYGAVSFRVLGALIQRNEVLGVERVDSVGVGFEIIKHSHRIEFQLLSQIARVDDPGQIGNLAPTASYRASHPETGAMHQDSFRFDEGVDDFRQA